MEHADGADDAENAHEDARKALNEMKKRYGSFKTAYKCITADIVWTAKCVNACTQPIWWINNQRVIHVKTPEQILQHEIKMTWWREEVQTLLDQTLCSHKVCSELGLFEPDAEVAAEHLATFFDQAPHPLTAAPGALPPPGPHLGPPHPRSGRRGRSGLSGRPPTTRTPFRSTSSS